MKDFEVKCRQVKLVETFIKYVEATIYRQDFQNFLMFPFDQKAWPWFCFKTCGWFSKTLSLAFQSLNHGFEALREKQ